MLKLVTLLNPDVKSLPRKYCAPQLPVILFGMPYITVAVTWLTLKLNTNPRSLTKHINGWQRCLKRYPFTNTNVRNTFKLDFQSGIRI